MSRRAKVYYRNIVAGVLTKSTMGQYTFAYAPAYLANAALPPISFSFPKSQAVYQSPHLFPFFFGLLSEGFNKGVQCKLFRIDEVDYFDHLLKTAMSETAGAITVKEIKA